MDLIVNPEVRRNFEVRSAFVKYLRNFLDSRGYMEVETPVLITNPDDYLEIVEPEPGRIMYGETLLKALK